MKTYTVKYSPDHGVNWRPMDEEDIFLGELTWAAR